jgi:hypothetical protein
MLSNKAIRSVFFKYNNTIPSSLPSRGQRALPFTYLLLLPSSAGLLGRGRGLQGFAILFPLLLLSFLFFSLDGKGGGVDNALRGKGGERGGGEGDEIQSIKAALIY